MCNSLTLAAALDRAIRSESQIINMSLAGPKDPLVARLVRLAHRQGAIVIAADPILGSNRYPALLPEVLAVTDRADLIDDDASAAPFFVFGSEILSTVPGGHFDFFNGSSLSTARASAIAAHTLESQPDLEWDARLNAMTEIAELLGMR